MCDIQNTTNKTVLGNLATLVRETTSQPSISEFFESLELVGSNVFYLFANKQVSAVAKKIFRIETRSDTLKRKIIFLAKGSNCSTLLDFIEGLTNDDIKEIGVEFFYITSKKISKNHSIENYITFIKSMYKKFGLVNTLVKNFFFVDRDIEETVQFIESAKEWADESVLSTVVLISLDRLSNNNRLDEMTQIIDKYGSLIKGQTESNKPIQRVVIRFLQSVIHNNGSAESVVEMLEKVTELGFSITSTLLNKILDLINRSFRNDGLLEAILEFVEKHNIETNLVTQNSIIDFHCSTGQFDKAYALFEELESRGYQPDNYTYSILIKGIKTMKKPDIETADKLFKMFMTQNSYVDIVIFNSILDVFISNGLVEKAAEVYDIIKSTEGAAPDQITFNTLIKGCCKHKDFDNAMKYFTEMKSHSLKPTRITYNSLMDLAVKDAKLKNALFLIEEMQKDDIAADGYTYSIILNGLKLNESPPHLVKISLENLRKVMDDPVFKLDEALFNTILDVCSKYEMYESMDFFFNIMLAKNVKPSIITFGILLKSYNKKQDFDRAFGVFEKMMEAKVAMSEVTYGGLLDACAKIGRMDLCAKIYDALETANLHMNSIIFTTIIKGYIKKEQYTKAIDFFAKIKKHVQLTGMIITYNCALDTLVRKGDLEAAISLFEQINKHFKADLITFSTIIKGLCLANKKQEAFECVKEMINSDVHVDVSVINLFLDSCSNSTDYKLGIQAYQYTMMKNVVPNEITFGIMVKLFGFAKELHKAFDLLDLMMVYEITPSIIVFTNLVHISFYNRNPKKADLAFTLFKKQGLKGDRLLYSKLIDGFLRFNDHSKVLKYIDLALADHCQLKKPTMDQLLDYFYGDERMNEKLAKFRQLNYVDTTETKEERIRRLESQKTSINVKARNSTDRTKRVRETEGVLNNDQKEDEHRVRKNFNNDEGQGKGKQFGGNKGLMRTDGFNNAKGGVKKETTVTKGSGLFNFRNKA